MHDATKDAPDRRVQCKDMPELGKKAWQVVLDLLLEPLMDVHAHHEPDNRPQDEDREKVSLRLGMR